MVVNEGLSIVIMPVILATRVTYLSNQAQLQLSEKSLAVTGQGYLDLVKASWILVDVIKRHPQLNLLNADIRYEVVLLAEVSYFCNDKPDEN